MSVSCHVGLLQCVGYRDAANPEGVEVGLVQLQWAVRARCARDAPRRAGVACVYADVTLDEDSFADTNLHGDFRGRGGDTTSSSSYCERRRESPGGAKRSEERAEWSTRACAG